MKQNFPKSLEHVLVHEGGYVDHPNAPGGPTSKGITLRVFQRIYGEDKTREDLKAITDEQVNHIYYIEYWQACRCDDLGRVRFSRNARQKACGTGKVTIP